ncbi:perlucin-like protein [Argopecten irradians]|uniref:perlucin-like protein n=1 Tax=Argopecten irradians TaxID=31199 RepID=UPI00371D118F
MAFVIELIGLLFLFGSLNACSDGWIKHGDECFLFSHNQVTWTEAMDMCQFLDSKLAEPMTAELDAFIGSQSKQNHRRYWLGGTDIPKEGTWIWMSNQETMTYTNWHAPDPNNGNQGEDCLLNDWWYTGKWADGECEWKEYYICQRVDDSFSSGLIG